MNETLIIKIRNQFIKIHTGIHRYKQKWGNMNRNPKSFESEESVELRNEPDGLFELEKEKCG